MENLKIDFFEESYMNLDEIPSIDFCNKLILNPEQNETLRSARTIGITRNTYTLLILNKEIGVHLISGYGSGKKQMTSLMKFL